MRMTLSLVISLFFVGQASASGLAGVGTEVSYKCKSGPGKTRTVLFYGDRGSLSSLYMQFGSGGKGDITIEYDAELWQYLSGIGGWNQEGDLLKILTPKSGNLTSANNLKEGSTYTGVVTYWDRRMSYDMKMSIQVGKATREKTALGAQNLIPVTTTIENADGKGGKATVSVKFSPVFRFNVEEKIAGALPERGWDCVTAGIKMDKELAKSAGTQFAWPDKGTVLKYQCKGDTKELEYTIQSAGTGNSVIKLVKDGKATEVETPPWLFYAGLVKKISANGKVIRTFDTGGNGLTPLAGAGVKPGAYHGTVNIPQVKDGKFTIRVAIHPETTYKTTPFGLVDIVPVVTSRSSATDLVNSKFFYSKELKAPVWFSLDQKFGGALNRECTLMTHSTYKKKG
ncbi:MAG: hypothetical protein H6624_05295 [Bdellovibrionaceae bacterium]|nr:hypothetical protein [Bdellovibrionales bacterium]MCB9083734.1 hypothetical protein [Pseudobdellovibrionaceae bacterium]